jgi:CBS domain-containing protein
MKVADVMTPRVFSVVADAPVSAAVEYMADSNVSALAVTDDHGQLLGLVSSSDILRAASEATDGEAREQLFDGTRVAEIMSRRPLRITADDDLRDAARQMLYADVHRLFVEENGWLVGVISQTDIVRALGQGGRVTV